MASVVPSSLVSDIRGSVGTNTWSRNRAGLYVKARKSPLNPNTIPQQNARALIRNGTAAWKALTNDQRNKYAVIAQQHLETDRVGRVFPISGFNLFIRQYTFCIQAGAPAPTTISEPIMKSVAQPVNFPINVGAWKPSYNGLIIQPNQRLFFYGLKYRIASQRGFNPSQARLVKIVTPAFSADAIDMDAEFNAILGNLGSNVGKRTGIAMRTVNLASGEASKIHFVQYIISLTPTGWVNI